MTITGSGPLTWGPGVGSAFIAEATVAKRILDHLGLDSRGPPLARAQAPPDPLDPAPSHDGTDPVFPDWQGQPSPAGPSLASAAEGYPLPGRT